MVTHSPGIRRNRVLQGAAAALVVLGLLLWWLLPLGEPAPRGAVTFSTGVKSGVYQRYGELLQQDLARGLPNVSVTLRTSQGSPDNLTRVATGEADFTIATADAVSNYLMEKKPGWQRLRGCARLYDDYVQLIVAKDSKIHSVADLRGARVGVGQPESGVRLVADRVLEAANLNPRTGVREVFAGIDKMPGKLQRGELDAFFWSGGLPTSAVEALADRFAVRLVPLDGPLVKQLHAAGPATTRYYRSAAMPADAYPKAPSAQDVPTIAVANLLVTTDRMDAALTEGFTRTVIDSRDRIGREVHSAQLVDLRTAIYTDPLPLHEGAKRYYQSVKP
ncbi:TAXI family TRAP transporter solute-binding subunit [Streptomyces liangshanensis]|uniref:TAXI family TRAP transporter solute-binding subunit n=1 Tax=Streptomyces liangshanensis TaxID=2717324 RepID=A0A6G9GVL7_9ACTN|nr:TAXI family TRAP transporter solute-binding subunit [Streptomyces liangshanensis]QIQ02312.1 TAXI family TRAP transporter solute-binding subunit [Streptomyces liangshanensis]